MAAGVGAVDSGAGVGAEGSLRPMKRRTTPTKRITKAPIERYHPTAGPQLKDTTPTSGFVYELEPVNEDQGPLVFGGL